ncbi:MAG: IS200/IS605 family transposase [Phycisphaerae bacterium]|nr:IS200/IS605 family transposase [Phycisphaerae bacterium]
MTTYTQILYHIVFGTQHHYGCLDLDRHDALCAYIAGILKNHNCIPYKLGGYTDHIHILASLHPSIPLSDLVKDIKLASSSWIKKDKVFPSFSGWQDGYGAFTCSWSVKSEVEEYIARQAEHHRRQSFRQEYMAFLQRAGVDFDDNRFDESFVDERESGR